MRAALAYGARRGMRTALQTLGGTLGALQISGLTSSLGQALLVAGLGALLAGAAAAAQNAGDALGDHDAAEPEARRIGFGA